MLIMQNEETLRSFPNQSCVCDSDGESISDDVENTMLSKIECEDSKKVNSPTYPSDAQCGTYSWCEATKEAGELLHLNENTACSSSTTASLKSNTQCKGRRGKAKHTFSFRSQSHKKETYNSLNSKDELHHSSELRQFPEESEHVAPKTAEHSMAEILEDFQRERSKGFKINEASSGVEPSGPDLAEYSMSSLLNGLQDKSFAVNRNFKKSHSKRGKSILSLGDRNINNEDSLEPFGCGTSSDEEADNKKLKPATTIIGKSTLMDHFHDILGAACIDINEGSLFKETKHQGCGLIGRLHRILQNEKETEKKFSRMLQTDDKSGCIDVVIMSKNLDAKLTVCDCAFREHQGFSKWPNSAMLTQEHDEQKIRIIFNSRVCTDIDLDIGNFIRIYPPWEKVPVSGNADYVLLSSYYSQILTRP